MKKFLTITLCLISVSIFAQPAGYKSGSWMSDWWANTGYGATDAPSFMVISGLGSIVATNGGSYSGSFSGNGSQLLINPDNLSYPFSGGPVILQAPNNSCAIYDPNTNQIASFGNGATNWYGSFIGSHSGNAANLTNLTTVNLVGIIPISNLSSNTVNQSIFSKDVDVVFIGDSLTDKSGLWGGTNWAYFLSNKLSVAYSPTFHFITNSAISGNRVNGAGGILARYSSEITPLWQSNGHQRLVLGDGFVNDLGNVAYANMQIDFSNLVYRVHSDGAYLLWWDIPVVTNNSAAQEYDRLNMNDFESSFQGVDYLYQVSQQFPSTVSQFRYDNVHFNTNGYYVAANAVFGLLNNPPKSQQISVTASRAFRNAYFQGSNSFVNITNGSITVSEASGSGRNPILTVAQDSGASAVGLQMWEKNGDGSIFLDNTYNPLSSTGPGIYFRQGTSVSGSTLITNMILTGFRNNTFFGTNNLGPNVTGGASGMYFTNAAGSKFALQVNTTTNGFVFIAQ